jgi:hypothetical protein
MVIQTMTDDSDDVASSLDISSVNSDDSDLDSSELTNPDLTESMQSVYGSPSGGSGTPSIIGTYTGTYSVYNSTNGYSRQFTDSGEITGTLTEVGAGVYGVSNATLTSVDGLFDQLGTLPTASGSIVTGESPSTGIGITVYGFQWSCSSDSSSSQGIFSDWFESDVYLTYTGNGTCSVTTQ